ncbi:MAG: thioredoxin domain-containing protein [Planctomycetota bacterium]
MLGFNTADDPKIAKDLLDSRSATFPNVMDNSLEADMVSYRDYRTSGVPVNYIIDREGKIVDGWYGNDWSRGGRAILELSVK